MSIPQRLVVRNFMHLFSNQQKLNLEIKLRYISSNYNYLNNYHEKAKKDFMFVIRNGAFHLKLRSLLKLILMAFK